MKKFIYTLFLALFSVCFASNEAPQGKTIFLTILARNKGHLLPRYLKMLENLEYDKKLITVYINTNNNEDDTEDLLKTWMNANKNKYCKFIYENNEIKQMPKSMPHDWCTTRLKLLGEIRNKSLRLCKESGCDFYFTSDCDNFLAPDTLKILVEKDKPIVAPLLYDIPEKIDFFATYWYDMDENGYFKDHPDFWNIFYHKKVGTFKVALVHCTYLVKSEYLDKLSYVDSTERYEFIVFADSARKNNVDMYICNEKNFGVQFAFWKKNMDLAEEKRLLKPFLAIP